MRNCFAKVMNSGLVWLLLSVVVIVIDRGSKVWMLDHLQIGEPVALLPILNLTLAYNTGAAFSFLNSASGWQHFLLGGLALVVTIFIISWLASLKRNQYWQNIALSLIAAGALGNAWDRILYGHVIDFVNFHLNSWHFAIFNLADSAICVGAFMLIVMWMFQQHK
ncbi:MAG TPA: signal peptidase II [Gammaproteobacteria bacterium]|nr:signal peptidase II [Gammaproteobacteria bacterium]